MAQKVLVTGATGFIAMHVVLALLDKGYEVRGTARSKDKADALNATLSTYSGKPVEIELVSADLNSDAGWDEAVTGCDFVQHVASPIPSVLPKDADQLIRPARDGTLRVLKAAKAAGIPRVVMTSSVAAVAYGWGDQLPSVLDETHWSNPDDHKDNTVYTRSKTIAERAAWDYVAGEGTGLELATINPVAVLGPAMSSDFSASLEIVTQLMGGGLPAIPKFGFDIVDVRDVADLHVLAMESDKAAGERFIASSDHMMFRDIAAYLRETYPDYRRKIPTRDLPNTLVRGLAMIVPVMKQILPEVGKKRTTSNEKARSLLGWSPRSGAEAVKASADSLIANGAL